ncbi:MAG: polysulfide reductase [Alphaproteobacteria bacterium]|nr:polysulfide reductase [Alphaproteobacteria bacterium]
MTTSSMSIARPNTVLVIAAIGLVVTLGMAGMNLMAQGHAAFNTNSVGISWGLPIVTYDYFLLTSTGLTLVASLPLVFELKSFQPVAKRCVWLAIAGLVGGVSSLALELGSPIKAISIIWTFQTGSPLFWKVLFVLAHFVLLVVLFARMRGGGPVRGIAAAQFVAALGIALIAGAVYGMMAMRPFWFGGDVPVAFLIESFLGGLAFIIFFSYLAHGFNAQAMPADLRGLFGGALGATFAVVIALHAAFVGARVVTGLWSNAEGLEVWGYISSRPLFHVEIWLGIALPLVLMGSRGTRQNPTMQIAAAVLVMISLLISRYDFIIGGQMVPLFKGSWAPSLLAYVPSTTEWLVFLAAIFLANVVNAYGEWKFDLDGR